jgi:hypothetical protein
VELCPLAVLYILVERPTCEGCVLVALWMCPLGSLLYWDVYKNAQESDWGCGSVAKCLPNVCTTEFLPVSHTHTHTHTHTHEVGLGMALRLCNHNYLGGVDRRILVQGRPWAASVRHHLEK